jgi:AraC family transcriptional regulator
MSTSYFFRAFKGSFGVPPHAYIIQRRMERAELLLSGTDEPLGQIAIACGLADQAHFTRLFRRAAGVPPGVGRRQLRGGTCSGVQASDVPG